LKALDAIKQIMWHSK